MSGGGYIGSFLGRFYDRLTEPRQRRFARGAESGRRGGAGVSGAQSKVIEWLRRHGNYIAPQGSRDGWLNFAVFVRNLLSMHLVVGLAIFASFGLANLVRYGLFDRVLAGTTFLVDRRTSRWAI